MPKIKIKGNEVFLKCYIEGKCEMGTDDDFSYCLKDIVNLANELRKACFDAIKKQDVISLYPDGAHKEKAKVDFANAQNTMLAALEKYDGAYRSLKEDYQKEIHFDNIKIPTGHEYIETFFYEYRNTR